MSTQRYVYWENTDNGHSKFWAAQIIEKRECAGYSGRVVNGVNIVIKYVLVRKWGAINTKGQGMEQEFDNKIDAQETLNKLVWEKEAKGYTGKF